MYTAGSGSQVLVVGGGGRGDVSRLRQQCCSQAGAAAASTEIAGAHATTAPVYCTSWCEKRKSDDISQCE
jgi:hypothetical protein